MATDDSDPAILDWGPDALTTVDQPHLPDADTAKYKSLEYATGREAGFSEGVSALVAALARELDRAGLDAREADRICHRVRDGALRSG